MSKRTLYFLFTAALIVGVLLLFPDPAMAAPGGRIASAIFRTVPGKILLVVLTIIFLPLIISVMVQEARAEKSTRKALESLARQHPEMDWFAVKNRVTEVFTRVHAAWRKEDMQEASDWMTHWYWQNQQIAHLEQWERDGLINHCRVKSLKKIRPLYLKYKNEDGTANGTRIVVGIDANMEDYLAERVSGKVVQGKPGYDDVESVWTLVLENGRWLVENIEDGALTLQYAKIMNELSKASAGSSAANATRREA
ncbi:MAG: lipoprotein [Capsulimonas sp.]|jgi:hypothetical protein|nr:lipoprotein [Capsulimonas sp.]